MRMRSVVLSAVVLAAMALPSRAGDLEEAQKLRDSGDWEAAVVLYQKAVAADATSADAALGLGETLTGLGRFREAKRALKAGIDANPGHLGLLVARARSEFTQADQGDATGMDPNEILGYVAGADVWIKKALAVDPTSAAARVMKAKVFRYQGGSESAESMSMLEAVIADHPDHFDAHWDYAQAHMRVGTNNNSRDKAKAKAHFVTAEKHFVRCTEIDATSGDAHWFVGNARAWQGKAPASVAGSYAKAAELLPGNDKVLSQLYRWMGKDKAGRVAAFEKVRAARPNEGMVSVFLAYAQQDAGDSKLAFKTLADARKTDPSSPFVPLNEGHLHLGEGNAESAISAYEAAIATCGDSFVKGVYDDINKRVFESSAFSMSDKDRLWTMLWTKWPGVPDAANNAGLTYRDRAKDYQKSLEWYLRAAPAGPQSPQIQNDTALILDQYLKRHDEAEPYYVAAIKAGAEQGRNWRGAVNGESEAWEHVGYRDALNNYGMMLVGTKQWTKLKEFVEGYLPEEHPRFEAWKKLAENG